MDPKHLLEAFGTLGLLLIIYAETGLLVGFFLPGDSLLFTAGLLCAPGMHDPVHLNLAIVLPGVFVAAVLGAQTGWYIGHRAGPALLRRKEGRFFKQRYVDEAQEFFEKGGTRAVVLARFVPIVRTFLNPLAGIARMPARTFLVANLVGGLLWSVGVTLAGYALGKTVPNVDRYLYPIVALVVLVSLVPVFLEFRRRRSRPTGPAGP
ncbi:MAG: rane-associated protein [Acidimicrobiaceae bacterium]|nr:rane-associated protein [Acidimicrobiaceae bacterium]